MKSIPAVFTLVAALVVPASPGSAVSDENGRISFDSFRDGPDVDIWATNPDGSNPVNLTANFAGADFAAAWSPSGRRIVFLRNVDPTADDATDTEIWVMRADGSRQRRLTHNAKQDDSPAWSPGGRRIVFQRDPDGEGPRDGELWVMRADGSRARQLTHNRVEDNEPVWSPNGRRIAFSRDSVRARRVSDFEVFDMRPNGRHVRQLTDADGFDGGPDYSPDGKHIGFDSERDGDPDVYVMSRNGGKPTQLTGKRPAESAVDILAAYSPDGRFIAFDSNRDSTAQADNNEVYIMRADGSRERNLTRNPAFDAGPDWQPLDDD